MGFADQAIEQSEQGKMLGIDLGQTQQRILIPGLPTHRLTTVRSHSGIRSATDETHVIWRGF